MAKHGKPVLSRSDLLTQRNVALAELDRAQQALHNKCSELEAKNAEFEALHKKNQSLEGQCQHLTDENKRLHQQLESVSAATAEIAEGVSGVL
jgi:predicted nuclease with TOPRIM domain